jgi:hypothetical protein
MLTADESLDELIQRLVAQCDVRTAEGRDHLHAGALEASRSKTTTVANRTRRV